MGQRAATQECIGPEDMHGFGGLLSMCSGYTCGRASNFGDLFWSDVKHGEPGNPTNQRTGYNDDRFVGRRAHRFGNDED